MDDPAVDDWSDVTVEYVDQDGNVTEFPGIPEQSIDTTGGLSVQSVVPSSISWTTWGACGTSTSSTKIVRTFSAGAAPLGSVYFRTVRLRCGNSSFGYRHIAASHSAQWQTLSNRAGGLNWRYFADWAIAQTLSHPYRACQNVRDNTVNYVGLIQFKGTNGAVLATYYPRVPTGKTTYNIITAFPQSVPNTGC